MGKGMTRAQIPASEIHVDHRYQRAVNHSWVKKIAATFNPVAVGVIHTSLRNNGKHYVIDGQHRLEAVKVIGTDVKDFKFDSIVHHDLEISEEARLFSELNSVKRMRMLDSFRARLCAGDPAAKEIASIVRGCGMSISDGQKDGNLASVGACERVYRMNSGDQALRGPEILKRTLRVVTEAWGVTADAVNGDIITGCGLLIQHSGDDIDPARLISKLASVKGGAGGTLGRGRAMRDTTGGAVADGVAEVIRLHYNVGLRTNRIPPLR
jgi:hypothetical protein